MERAPGKEGPSETPIPRVAGDGPRPPPKGNGSSPRVAGDGPRPPPKGNSSAPRVAGDGPRPPAKGSSPAAAIQVRVSCTGRYGVEQAALSSSVQGQPLPQSSPVSLMSASLQDFTDEQLEEALAARLPALGCYIQVFGLF